MESLIKFVQDEFVTKKEFPEFGAGDTITAYYEIREGDKTRTQFFRGVVIQKKGTGSSDIRRLKSTVCEDDHDAHVEMHRYCLTIDVEKETPSLNK